MVNLSRNKFFYKDLSLEDKIENRIMLIFFHFALILRSAKGKNKTKESQNIFDNIFQNIEINIRELGYGDTKVNKTMKDLSKIFYDILSNIDKEKIFSFNNDQVLLKEYFYNSKKIEDIQNVSKLGDYFEKFQNFCFDLDVNNMLNGSIEFKYR